MAKRLQNKQGQNVAIELTLEEMCELLAIDAEKLIAWREVIKPFGRSNPPVYRFRSLDDLKGARKKIAVLRTGMSPQAVLNTIDAGLLDSYAALAEDCPAGVTAHVWRSYALVVLMQVKYHKMIDAQELAERAALTEPGPNGRPVVSVETARQHLRLLQGFEYLKVGHGEWEGQWMHKGLPQAWQFDQSS